GQYLQPQYRGDAGGGGAAPADHQRHLDLQPALQALGDPGGPRLSGPGPGLCGALGGDRSLRPGPAALHLDRARGLTPQAAQDQAAGFSLAAPAAVSSAGAPLQNTATTAGPAGSTSTTSPRSPGSSAPPSRSPAAAAGL